ncbi:MAG TPA: MBL fold metallo-hydrolase [Thermoanaerobaculia bacterium]|nr:MBL fold metallo-hydrolase [Thermoanaerobaculia bacterium]
MSEEPGGLYEKVLRHAAGGTGMPPVRASAAVIPWRRRGNGIEVFWIRRADSLPFMGGWHAFPGGGLSRSDASIRVTGEPAGLGELPPAAGFPESLREEPGPDLLPGLLACAIRELFEETGILLAKPEAPEEDLAGAREESFQDLLARLGTVPDASRLVWAGRWVTPPFAPLRFDNRFFLLEWPESEPVQPSIIPGELEKGEWIDPAAAWEMWRRGDVLAAPPILHILDVLAHQGVDSGLGRLRDPSDTNLGPFRRIEMRPGVLMFPVATHTLPPAATTNVYLLGNGEAVLVDPGSHLDEENERLERALAAARERLGRRVVAIWLTHHHPDHIGGVERLRQSLGVPVLAHALTAERLAARGVRGMRVDGELTHGQRVVLAGEPSMTVMVLHTPGHARGHLCFLEEEQRSTLVGDLVAGLGTIVIDPPEGDMDDYLGSLAKLAMMRPGTLFPGHGPAILDGLAKLREYYEHRLWREAKVLEAWEEGLREPSAMLPKVYGDTPQQAWPLAERQILAHLARLRQNGRIAE